VIKENRVAFYPLFSIVRPANSDTFLSDQTTDCYSGFFKFFFVITYIFNSLNFIFVLQMYFVFLSAIDKLNKTDLTSPANWTFVLTKSQNPPPSSFPHPATKKVGDNPVQQIRFVKINFFQSKQKRSKTKKQKHCLHQKCKTCQNYLDFIIYFKLTIEKK